MVDDEYWQIRVRFGEFGDKFAVQGMVDGFPESIAAGQDLINVCWRGVSNVGQCQDNTEHCSLDLPGGLCRQ